jgi:hypothetical protein
MRVAVVMIAVLFISSHLQADDTKKTQTTIYPIYLQSLSFDLKLIPDIPHSTGYEEIVEVNSDLYPGLDLQLSQPDELLNFQKFELTTPMKGPSYFQPGGPVLYYYGIYMPSGQLVSLPVTPKSKD